jgi:phage-related protein
LIGTSDAIREFEKTFEQAGGTVEKVAEKQLDTATQQLKLLKNSVVDIFIGSGKQFDEGFTDVIRKLREWVDSIGPNIIEAAGEFAKGVDDFVTNIQRIKSNLTIFAETGKDYPLFYDLSDSIKTIVGWIKKLIEWWQNLSEPVQDAIGQWAKLLPWITLAAGAIKLVGIVIGVFLGPAALVAGVIAGLIILFQHLWENNETFREGIKKTIEFFQQTVVPILTEAWDQIKAAIEGFLSWFQSEEGAGFLQSVWARIQEAAAAVVTWFQTDLVPFLTEAWEQIKQVFQAAWDFIKALWDFILPFLKGAWEAWGESLVNIIGTIWEFIKEIFLGAWQIIEGIFKFFTGLLTLNWTKMWEGIKEILSGAWRIIRETVEGAWEIIWEFLTGAWRTLGEVWSALWKGIKNAAEEGWNIFLGWLNGIWTLFTAFWENSWETIKDAVGTVMGGIADVIRAPFNTVLGVIEALVNNAINGINGMINLINKIPGVNVGTVGNVSLPRLALGGEALRQGLALVGERGPEIIKLAKGAQVIPLNDSRPAGVDVGPAIRVDNVNFYGTPLTMLEDYKRQTKLALRGL